MWIIQMKWWFRLLKFIFGHDYIATNIFLFIIVREKPNRVTLNHERIHIFQQMEMLFVFFWIAYVSEFFIRLFFVELWHRDKSGAMYRAYMGISFEREAYAYEKDLTYLSYRKGYNWFKKRYYTRNHTRSP